MKYVWINCFCGKDIHPLDMPKHFQSKHEWPNNEHPGTTQSETQDQNEAGSCEKTAS
jgi:hypothetical protein